MAYWLMKSEPDTYSIDDLKRAGTEHWEGCRNYTVRNFFRDSMSVGDEAFFYNSSCNPAGVVGLMRIASEAYPDPTQFDPKSDYYDPKSPRDNPRWLTRDVTFVKKFKGIVTLGEMRDNPALQNMLLLRKGQRLSVLPVEPDEWKAIMAMVDKL